MTEDFDGWYAGLRPAMVAALSAWCGDPSVAADAVDEAFVRAFERWDRVSEMESSAGWVWTTATNQAKRRARRLAMERRLLLDRTADTRSVGRAPDADIDLRQALRRLPERQRTALVLHYVADLSQRDVAAAMGVAEGTVAATLNQARRQLAKQLDESAPTPVLSAPAEGALP